MKQCPKCKSPNPLAAQTCYSCGHIFKTQFPQATERTTIIQSGGGNYPVQHPGQYIPPPNQPQFDYHQAQQIAQGAGDAGKGVKWIPWAIIIGAFIIASPCLGCYGLAIIGSCNNAMTRPNPYPSPAEVPLSASETELVGWWAHVEHGGTYMMKFNGDRTGEYIMGSATTRIVWERTGNQLQYQAIIDGEMQRVITESWLVSGNIAYVNGAATFQKVR